MTDYGQTHSTVIADVTSLSLLPSIYKSHQFKQTLTQACISHSLYIIMTAAAASSTAEIVLE